jgi:hypothetical protein
VSECSARLRALLILTLLIASSGCSSASDELQQHHRKIQSLKSTAVSIGRAWTAGQVSSTFASTGLERAFQLLEQERAALASSAVQASRQQFAAAIADAEAASRTIAAMGAAVESGARDAVERHVDELSTRAGKQL